MTDESGRVTTSRASSQERRHNAKRAKRRGHQIRGYRMSYLLSSIHRSEYLPPSRTRLNSKRCDSSLPAASTNPMHLTTDNVNKFVYRCCRFRSSEMPFRHSRVGAKPFIMCCGWASRCGSHCCSQVNKTHGMFPSRPSSGVLDMNTVSSRMLIPDAPQRSMGQCEHTPQCEQVPSLMYPRTTKSRTCLL